MPSPAKNFPISTPSQFIPPWPQKFTDRDLPSLAGKVYIATGAASGTGYHLVKTLYVKGATVYIAARSQASCGGAVEQLLSEMNNLMIRPAAESFLRKEPRPDVLVHSAAGMGPPPGSKDKQVCDAKRFGQRRADTAFYQGNDLELGTNCLGLYILTLLLKPVIVSTAAQPITPAGSVRITWEVSILQGQLQTGGMMFEPDGTPTILTKLMANYMQSRVGIAWITGLFAERLGEKVILKIRIRAVNDAYRVLCAVFSPEITMEDNGGYLMAWSRKFNLPDEIQMAKNSVGESGGGSVRKFLDFCNKQLKDFP
ncbi:hypothetical protein DL98DRAFT_652145 [Cadophora sp. DSE1049]|nr:hypothetical protein DL98DRAFT_652145 [Cadophora sp. DSE1049]